MRVNFLISGMLAMPHVALGMPSMVGPRELEERHDDLITEHILFKRDDVLTPQDFDLAKRHGVDINEMYKHSVFKRSNGDDYTVWVHNSYNETIVGRSSDAETGLEARQERTKNIMGFSNRAGESNRAWWARRCDGHNRSWQNTVHRDAAYTGGGNAIIAWAERSWGYFILPASCCPDSGRANLIVGGSNSGANLRFGIGVHPSDWRRETQVGSSDIGDLTKRVRDGRAEYGNGWRMEGHGGMRCRLHTDRAWPGNWVAWVLHRSAVIV